MQPSSPQGDRNTWHLPLAPGILPLLKALAANHYPTTRCRTMHGTRPLNVGPGLGSDQNSGRWSSIHHDLNTTGQCLQVGHLAETIANIENYLANAASRR